MRAWPYRKIKSIRNLISVVESNPEQFEVRRRVRPHNTAALSPRRTAGAVASCWGLAHGSNTAFDL